MDGICCMQNNQIMVTLQKTVEWGDQILIIWIGIFYTMMSSTVKANVNGFQYYRFHSLEITVMQQWMRRASRTILIYQIREMNYSTQNPFHRKLFIHCIRIYCTQIILIRTYFIAKIHSFPFCVNKSGLPRSKCAIVLVCENIIYYK